MSSAGRNGDAVGFLRAVGMVFRTAVRHPGPSVSIAAIFAVPWGIANAVSRSSTRLLDPRTLTESQAAGAAIAWLASIGAMTVIALFLGSVSVGALSLVGSAAIYGDQVDARGIVRRAFDRALEAVAANLVTALIVSIGPVVLGIAAYVFATLASPSLGFAVLVWGSFVLAPIMVYVGVHLLLAIPVVMREGRGAVDALRRSWRLVAGGWLWTTCVFIVLALPPVALQQLAETVIGRGRPVDFVFWALASAAVAALGALLFGIGTGVVYACRAPEDVVPPDVALSEARADAAGLYDSGAIQDHRPSP